MVQEADAASLERCIRRRYGSNPRRATASATSSRARRGDSPSCAASSASGEPATSRPRIRAPRAAVSRPEARRLLRAPAPAARIDHRRLRYVLRFGRNYTIDPVFRKEIVEKNLGPPACRLPRAARRSGGDLHVAPQC